MDASHSLIAELEDAIESGSKDKRVDTLRRITDLFVSGADRLNDQQIDVFDDVLATSSRGSRARRSQNSAGASGQSTMLRPKSCAVSRGTTISRWQNRF
jgi:hypothetical protein